MDEPEIKKRRSLSEILNTFSDIDAEFIALTSDELDLLQLELVEKIDNTKVFLDSLRAQSEVYAEYGRKFAARAKALENRAVSLENYVLTRMQSSGWLDIHGQYFTVQIKKSKYVDTVREATAMDAIRAPEFVRKAWAWDKRAISDHLKKTGVESLMLGADEVARIAERPSVEFSIKKEVKK